jgi:hypothetical protein
MAKAAAGAAFDLGRLAVEETGIGRVHYKVLKNLFGAEGTWASIKDEKTVGIVTRDEKQGIVEIATPAGVVACIIPTTNPTSTAIFKALIAVKGRNAVVISPHPRARRCIFETVEVLRAAIERAGGIYLPERLHRVRIEAKKLRYALELQRELTHSRSRTHLNRLKSQQDLLGRMHDLEILIDRTRAVQASLAPRHRRAMAELDALIRVLEDECREGHAAYMHTRPALLKLCDTVSLAAGQSRSTAA